MKIQPLRVCSLSHNIFILLTLALIYFILGTIGHQLRSPDTNASTIWPASGFAIAAILLFGYRAALALFIGCWLDSLVHFLLTIEHVAPFDITWASGMIGIGGALQASLAVFAIRLFYSVNDLLSRPSAVSVLLTAGGLSCILNATIGVSAMSLSGITEWSDFSRVWFVWFIGDAGGVFLFTPLILSWFGPYHSSRPAGMTLEIIALTLFFIITTLFNYHTDARYFYLFLPGLLWAAMHFGFRGATLTLLYAMGFITYATMNHMGSFVRPSLINSLLHLELFVLTITATILILTGELEQRIPVHTKWKSPPQLHKYLMQLKNLFTFRK